MKIDSKVVMHREQWLTKATKLMRAKWTKLGVAVPLDVKLTCGFPGGGSPRRRIGECWPRSRSAAGINEVMISPVLDDTATVLDVLGHELLHAVDDCASKHGVAFSKNSRMVGYTGGKNSKVEGVAAIALLKAIEKKLGAYPHGKVALTVKTRNASHGLHKLECGCGNVSYMTAKKIEQHGWPVCGSCEGEMMISSERENKKVVETI